MNAQVAERSAGFELAGALGTVEQAMSKDIVLLAPDTHVGDAIALVECHHAIGGVVVEADRVVGIVGTLDLSDARALALHTGTLWGPGRGHSGWRVADVMTSCTSVVSPTDPLALALVKLDEGQLDGLPVVDEGWKPIGLLSRRDVIHTLADRVRGPAV